ncbi:MAG: hypothetical protein FWG68_03390 [Defluviitaleaceae bacterium]|nr:hypothetical protein [Defluviitaleaceae bacterium]
MIKIENPTYMTCREMRKKYPNCMVWVGKFKDSNETNGNSGGYPFALIEEDELGTLFLDTNKYPEWRPILEFDTFPVPKDFFFDFDENELERIINDKN